MYEVKITFHENRKAIENTYHVDLLSTVGYLLDDFANKETKILKIDIEKKEGNY